MIAVNVSTGFGTEITCIFYPGSYAIGCLINFTNLANEITYCIALQRFSNISASELHIFQSCNAKFDAGRYLLKVYDIERDGEISTLPAVIEEVLIDSLSTAVLMPSLTRKKQSNIGYINLFTFLSCIIYYSNLSFIQWFR